MLTITHKGYYMSKQGEKDLKAINDKIDAMFKKIDCLCDPDPEVGLISKLFSKTQKNTDSIKIQFWLIGILVVSLLGMIIEKALK